MDEVRLTKLIEDSFSATVRPDDAHIFEDYDLPDELEFLEMIKGKELFLELIGTIR